MLKKESILSDQVIRNIENIKTQINQLKVSLKNAQNGKLIYEKSQLIDSIHSISDDVSIIKFKFSLIFFLRKIAFIRNLEILNRIKSKNSD